MIASHAADRRLRLADCRSKCAHRLSSASSGESEPTSTCARRDSRSLSDLHLDLIVLCVVLHVERLEVVLELDVERALGRRQLDRHRLLAPRDLVDLGDVLPHEAVEEGLRELAGVALLVPRGRVRVAEELEALDGRLLLLLLGGQLGRVGRAEVHAEPLRRLRDRREAGDVRRAREHPTRVRLEAVDDRV